MLTQLSIKNFGLIKQIDIEFDGQLNILTGETGAGKSIIIEALRIVLGDRIHASQVRDPSLPCSLEAVFDLSQNILRNQELFTDFLTDDDFSFIIHRTYTPDGRNKVKINGQNVTISQLKNLGNFLVDFHGPHDHQLLLSPDSHIGMLDQLVDFNETLNVYQSHYEEYTRLAKELNAMQALVSTRDRETDLLSHQIKELEQVALNEEDYATLKQEQVKLNNAEKLVGHVTLLLQLLEGDIPGRGDPLIQAFAPMRHLNDIDEKTLPWMDTLTALQENRDQLLGDLRDYAESLAFDPRQAETIHARCDVYEDILRKFGPTLEQARKYYQEAKEKYDLLMNLEHNDEVLRKEMEKVKRGLSAEAKKLTQKRLKAALALKKVIETELSELGMSHVTFETRFEQADFHERGHDHVSFFISPNVGEDLKPLAEIVSSGEAARVMLGLKKALIQVDPVPVLIFDEIDAQIGGRLGTVTGKKLREIADKRQVILITHLPQIASFATVHFKVVKKVKTGRTLTMVECLDKEARVKELAQMMSGDKTSQLSLQHAQDMMTKAG